MKVLNLIIGFMFFGAAIFEESNAYEYCGTKKEMERTLSEQMNKTEAFQRDMLNLQREALTIKRKEIELYEREKSRIDAKRDYEIFERKLEELKRDIGKVPDDSEQKFVVEAWGYCNESDDCIRGLTCSDHQCVKSFATQSSANKKNKVSPSNQTTRTKEKMPLLPNANCTSDKSCGDGQICSENKCVVDFGETRLPIP